MENEQPTLIDVALAPPGTMFSVRAVAAVFSVSADTVRRLVDEVPLITLKMTGNWRISREEILKYVKKTSPQYWEATVEVILSPLRAAAAKYNSDEDLQMRDMAEEELRTVIERLQW